MVHKETRVHEVRGVHLDPLVLRGIKAKEANRDKR